MTEAGTAQQHYRDLIAAVRLIATIQKEVDREEGLGCLPSPAWRLLRNATNYLLKEAHAVLRGDKAMSENLCSCGRMEPHREAKQG